MTAFIAACTALGRDAPTLHRPGSVHAYAPVRQCSHTNVYTCTQAYMHHRALLLSHPHRRPGVLDRGGEVARGTLRVHLRHGVALRKQRYTDTERALLWAGRHYSEADLAKVAAFLRIPLNSSCVSARQRCR